MLGKQRLIGGHNMLAGVNGGQNQRFCGLNTAHGFHHDVDFRIVDQVMPIVGDDHVFVDQRFNTVDVADGDAFDRDRSACSLAD